MNKCLTQSARHLKQGLTFSSSEEESSSLESSSLELESGLVVGFLAETACALGFSSSSEEESSDESEEEEEDEDDGGGGAAFFDDFFSFLSDFFSGSAAAGAAFLELLEDLDSLPAGAEAFFTGKEPVLLASLAELLDFSVFAGLAAAALLDLPISIVEVEREKVRRERGKGRPKDGRVRKQAYCEKILLKNLFCKRLRGLRVAPAMLRASASSCRDSCPS